MDDEQAAEIQEFWEQARVRAKVGRLDAVTGSTAASIVPPPAWAFGDSPELADELLGLVLEGRKRGTATSLAELEAAGEALPARDDLSILLDGAGHPRALIRTTRVDVVPFGEVSEEFAAVEGEDDGTLASWRAGHERYLRRVLPATGTEFTDDLPVACERFEVLYPRAGDR